MKTEQAPSDAVATNAMDPQYISEVENYLTELDNYLIARMDDPRARLDHIEEAAQLLAASGADPVEEFGAAEAYAAALTEEQGHALPSWVRLIFMALGFALLWEAYNGAFEVLLYGPGSAGWFGYELDITTSIFYGVVGSFPIMAYFSPLALRTETRLPQRWSFPRFALLLVLVVVLVAVSFSAMIYFGVPFGPVISDKTVFTSIVAGCLVGGVALTWLSGAPKLIGRIFTASGFRPGSVVKYNPFNAPRVKFMPAGSSKKS